MTRPIITYTFQNSDGAKCSSTELYNYNDLPTIEVIEKRHRDYKKIEIVETRTMK